MPSMVRVPLSRELCAERCAAQCCRVGYLFATTAEMRWMKAHGKATFYCDRHWRKGSWVLDFASHGGKCPFLGPDSLCTIYEHRPEACRGYPYHASPICAAWPAEEGPS